MAQKTAVDWVLEVLSRPLITIPQEVIDKAKQMEKEQMKNMWSGGKWSAELGGNFEEYYSKIYGTSKENDK